MMLLALFTLFLVTYSNGNTLSSKSRPKCSTVECELMRNILGYENVLNQAKLCEDPVSAVCTNDNQFSFSQKSMLDLLKASSINGEFGQSILGYLNGTDSANQNSLKSLNIERKLFQQCMKFGNDPEKTALDMKTIIDEWGLMDKLLNNATWQTIDEELNALDFVHAFYDIKVSRNPLKPDQNIITLQPPAILTLLKTHFMAIVSRQDDVHDHFSKVNNILRANYYNETIELEKLKDQIHTDISEFLKYYLGTLAGVSLNKTSNVTTWQFTELPNLIMSINEWNETYNLNGTIPKAASINWMKVFNQEFQRVGIDVYGNELVYIKNGAYFEGLIDIMSFKNSYTLKAAAMLMHGIRMYIHRILNISGKSTNEEIITARSDFCISDIPLYGASYHVLRSWENNEIISSQRREIVQNVVDMMKLFIDESKLPNEKKIFYSKRIHDLSTNLIENKWNTSYISNYYENYNLTDNYLINMINYQHLIKRKELSALRDNPDTVMENIPFSIHSWDNPRDQIVLYTQMLYTKMDESSLGYLSKFPVEFYYGVYGTKVASYLYKALNDDKLNNGVTFEMLYPIPFTFMKYKTEIMDCFHFDDHFVIPVKFTPVGEDTTLNSLIRSFLEGIITQVASELSALLSKSYRVDDIIEYFGVSIAYRAMQKSLNNRKNAVEHDQLLQELSLSSDQIFYLSYFKTICDLAKIGPQLSMKSYMEIFEPFHCPSQRKLNVAKCKTLFELESTFHLQNNATIQGSVSIF